MVLYGHYRQFSKAGTSYGTATPQERSTASVEAQGRTNTISHKDS